MINKIKPSKFKAKSSQAAYLTKRRQTKIVKNNIGGLEFEIFRNVYKASTDTELMIETVKIFPTQTFLEVGCGAGVISIFLAKKARFGLGVDINPQAVRNSLINAKRHRLKNLKFVQSDLFKNVEGKFDVIVCNPPYSPYRAPNKAALMFWDFKDQMKKRFFKEVDQYLNPRGTIFFGWSDFADINLDLPFKLAAQNGFKVVAIKKKKSNHRDYNLFVLKLKRK